MNEKEIHNSRENRIKNLFRAPTRRLRLFSGTSLILQGVAIALVIATGTILSVEQAESKNLRDISFGREQSVNLLASKVDSSSWSASSNALSQDLDDSSLYQEFNQNNSAYLGESLEEETEVPNQGALDENDEVAPDEVPAESSEELQPEEQIETTDTEATQESEPVSEPEPTQEPEPEPEPEQDQTEEVIEEAPVSRAETWGVFARVDELYPLAQLTMTSSTELVTEIETVETVIASSTEEVVLEQETEQPSDNLPVHDITLSGFEAAPLDRGQLITGMQLRLSFGAALKSKSTDVAPYVDVLFETENKVETVGAILLDEEVSNAMNGGYFLFALPSMLTTEELATARVTVRYHGNIDDVEGMYLDAAWLEINTRIVTEEDLKARGIAEQLKHLKAPEHSVLLSDQLNFAREEAPVFNLRYESDQNFLYRGFMKLIGRDRLQVASIFVNHQSVGNIPMEPDVNITKEGLITIELKEEDLKDMPPGLYQINVQYKENGIEYTDTFDFQWGILSLNPHKSEYEVGETAEIALGALSPNGNTICDAALDLYVTDPAGFISKVPVDESGECNGNNVTDVPDYRATIPVTVAGEYHLYLERLDEAGGVIGFTNDTFVAVDAQALSIERNGPTRIYPRAPYKMELTVASDASFEGVLKERVPASFVISSTSAEITQDGEWQVLSWNISTMGEGVDTVDYSFDAPDISPYLYNLGPASLEGEVSVTKQVERTIALEAASSSASTSPHTVVEEVTTTENGEVFREHRQWQIASDATGSMLLLWAGASIPTGWTCVSCTGADPFYQRFIIGSSTAGITGGATTHTHTYTSATIAASAGSVSVGAGGGNNYSTVGHTHTITPTIGAASNLPSYRNLVVIQNNSAGEPTSIPTGAIALFDAAVPTGWTQYNAQNGFYVRGESVANRTLTGGSNTHTHSVTGTTGGAAGATNSNTGGGTSVANNGHTHTINTVTNADSNEPAYREVMLGQLNATSTLPNDVITMWTDTEPGDWNTVSSSSEPFSSRIFKPAATYGTTGGATAHTPANAALATGAPSATTNRGGTGNNRSAGNHTHTLNVTGFGSGDHLPPYRSVIMAKRAGGQPPAAPTVHQLFDNEKTGTSTPEFEFTAEDSVGVDSLVYQFQWDDDSDLDSSPLGDRTSDVETGCSPNCFENTVTGGDSSPFNENERIRFTIQSSLSNGTTYYWRVRAKKQTGSTWGSWSEVASFTHVVDTDPSQWMQTQDAQFDQGVFSNTETFGSDSVRIVQSTPVEALVVYGEGVVQTPRYRVWDGSAWGAELSAQSVGGTIQWIRTAAGSKRDEYVLATQDASNDVNVQVYDGTTDTWGDLTEVTATISDNTRRGVDVVYETQSGDAMVVYCDGDSDPSYRIWNGTSWSAASTITTTSANNCNYVTLAADPVSDEIIVVTRDTGASYEAQVWNGSSWSGTPMALGSMSDTAHEGIAVQYEESGGQAVVVVSNGNTNGFTWTSWNGAEWSTATAFTLGDDFEWGVLKRDDGSDKMSLCYIDNDADIGWVEWSGDAWGAYSERELTGNIFDGRAVSCEYEVTSGRDGYVMFPYSDDTNARYQVWNGSSWTAEASISTITDSWEVGSIRTGDGKILSYFHDDTNTQLDFSYWNGSAWSAIQTLETGPSVTLAPFRQPIAMVAKTYEPSSGSITTDPINFSLVPNRPTWGEVVWDTTEQNGTDVILQVLYATTTYCNTLVPDGVLAGNSTGFDANSSPLDLSGLSTTTYSSLCLRATLSSTNQNVPTLDDWTLSWERQPYLVQSQFRWYANRNNENPNDVWPAGATDITQNEAIPVEHSPGSGEILRLRLAVRTDNAALQSSAKAFKLQFAQENGICASSTAWYDVGAVGSTTAQWRGYNNLLAFDGSTLSTLLLSGSDVGGTYEEENDSDANPNSATVGQEIEWDWVLQHNGADDGVQYCFRMVNDEGVPLSDYEVYPSLTTNDSPHSPSLEKLFDNEQVASTSPWFEFAALDTENDDITYQIQVDNNHDFSSPTLDRNSLSNLSEFENIVTPADKDPFTVGQTVRFIPTSALTNNTTYYWRVRGKDTNGSNDWGDWSTIYSFRVNTGTTITTWYQTEQEQFDTDDLANTETTAFDDVILTTGFTTGTTTSSVIDYDSKTTGNAWGSLSWNDNEAAGSIEYAVEYYDNGTWSLVPDSYLPGNSAGFTSSPVSLLGLDPQVHNEIRVRAILADSGGSPRLLDWTVEWGYAVEQPTLLSLFDNEKTGTTTPTFNFTTTDPEGDDIQYEFSWSTDNTFTSSTTVTSGVSAGFTNVTTGLDTSPYFSGNTISYKMQSALSNNTTYWWRVRGRDPSGGNAWSVWSSARSFTVDTSVSVSTWFQTTDEQFATDELNSTETTGSDGVEVTTTIREAMVAYAEGTVQSPRYRIWNGTTWSVEASAQSVGGSIRFVETAASQSRDEYIVATQEATGRVRAQVYDGGSSSFGNLQTIISAVPGLTSRGYDIAYETSSGDALVVACNGTEATYYVWNGSSWSGPTAIALAVTANCNWIELASDPTSDEIIMVVRDATSGATDYQALVWNGSAWGNSMTMGSMSETADAGMAVEYEESGDRAVVVVSNGLAASFAWNSWNGSAWTGAATQADQDDFENGRLSRDEGTDDLALCSIDQDGQIKLFRWTGSTNSWNAYTTVDTLGNSKTGRPADCVYETTAGRDGYIMIPYSDTTNARSQFWNGTALSGEATLSTVQDSQEVRAVRTGDGNILAVFYDDTNTQYDFSYWNGTSWSTAETLEGTSITTTAPATIPISIAARKYPTFTSGTVYSSAIDFDDGSGLKWQSASFSDTTPGSSDVVYQVEYWDGDSWELIPNSALSNNSTGFSSSPIDLSQVSRVTYNTIRLKATLSCVGGNCPTLNDWTVTWSSGINVSGTLKQYDQTASSTSGTIAVAVNGTVQTGKIASVSNGSWSIPNVTAFPMDIVTVFVSGAADSAEAVGVTRYDGDGDITGMSLFERHLSLGSNDATTTPITNTDIGLYDFTNTEDIFNDVSGSGLTMCATTGCADAELYVRSGTYYTPGSRILTHDFENNGTFTAGAYTHEINGSWDNNGTTTMTGSSVVFAATSTSETVDSTGALVASFNNVTFGTTTGSGTWTLASALDIDGSLSVTRGTLARGGSAITVGGNLVTGTNGTWTGVGTTTFDGGTAAAWNDQNATKQNVGRVVVDGTSKIVTLAGNVAAQSITIGANDTLDASVSNYDLTIYGAWNNQNNFVARSGEVFFAATTSGQAITTAGDAFYDVSFSGSGGTWAFTEPTVLVNNDFRVAAGTVTLPTATSTIAGSFTVTGGNFGNNNGVLYFTSSGAETITFLGGAFTNVAYNMTFNGTGNWTITDTNATSTNDVRVTQGTLNFPSGVFAVGGTLVDAGGVFAGGTGTVLFYSASSEILTAGGSTFNNVTFAGAGSWSFSDTNVTVNRNLTVTQGTLTMPSGTMSIAGSYDNNATVTPGTGTVLFNSNDTGETIDFGNSALYNVTFNHASGGWTINANATTTNNLTLTSVASLTLDSGRVLSVGGTFTNSVGGAATTWTGSTLALRAGTYSINTKTNTGDAYNILDVAANTKISMWNSSAGTYSVSGSGSLYSQDHNAVDGDLYVFGAYTRTGGTEYWSYTTDFDGTALGGSPRQVDVRFAAGASASFTGATVNITGTAAATTTVANQGSGTYTVTATGGTLNAQHYQFSDLGGAGLSLLGGISVPSLGYGSYTVGAAGASAITLSSTTIDANPSKQISNVTFATSTSIAAYNVSQTDGTPASFWWFRNGTGNLYGEAYDNDTGDPGSVRFDDSSLVITISGTVYSDAGVTPITGGTCDGSTQVVRVVVEGGAQYTGSCSNVDGSYSIGGVVIIGDPTVTVYLDNAPGGQKGSVVTRTPTADITDMDIYANRVIVRHEDVDALTIDHLADFDNSDDSDLRFTAATTSGKTLTVFAGNELFVFATSTFTPGGPVTLAGNAGFNSYDGTLYIQNGATFNAYATSTNTIGGRLVLASGAMFSAASTTVVMNATTSGKSITAPSTVTFHELVFNGSGGAWNLGANIIANDDMTITAGTVTGTGSITLPNGSLTGNGILSLGAGTTTIAKTNTLGGTSAWTFYNLQLGNGTVVGTTTPVFTATTTVAGRLTIATAHFLDAGSTTWDLSGTGTVFVENGTFLEDTSTIRYSGAGSNVRSTTYYNLDINAGAGSQTYVATGLGIIVSNRLTVGGQSNSTFDVNTNDPALDVNGSLTIQSNGTFAASGSAIFTLAGSYTNSGTFTGNNGTVTFDGAGASVITPGSSSFSNVTINAAGTVTVAAHATATAAWRLLNAGSFTVSSGQVLAVGGTFLNDEGGAATTWTGSTLRLYGGNNYEINTATTSDSYATLAVADTTQIRMWNSNAGSYTVPSTASLYSQDHAAADGDLYIWGTYRKTTGTDHWSYATDFNGTALGGSSRKVDVFFASGASATFTGGSLAVYGAASASTTLQNQGSGTYGMVIGGTASSSLRYYEVTDINSSGLVLTGVPTVGTLSYGNLEVSQNGGSGMTVGGTVINANPAKNFTQNRFALNGVGSGFGVTATGTTVSAWRFANHYGDIDGEANDVDPGGDPGYIAWDDSAALITVSGRVYSDEGSTASGVCDGTTQNVVLRMAGISTYSASCNAVTGAYSISNVSYGIGDSFVIFIDGETEKGATVSKEPISNINNLDIYENRVIVRHENTAAITIDDMAVWDSSDDADIPFTAVSGSPDTVSLPANRKLVVWSGKTFAPGGNVTLSGGGGGAAYDGSLQLFANAQWTGAGTEALSVGGSFVLDGGATLTTANGTTTFTTSGAGRTIDLNEASLHNVAFTGSGSWTITDAAFTANGYMRVTGGTLDLPTGTTTVNGSFINNGGTVDANGGLLYLTGSAAQLRMGGSSLAEVVFTGGNYSLIDTHATTTESVTIESGTITLTSGTLAVGGDFENLGGAITHNNTNLIFTNATAATLLASSSDLYGVTFRGGGNYTMADDGGVAFLDDFIVSGGSDVALASGTISVGGSLSATGGVFTNATTTFLFNSADAGETINPGSNEFYAVQIAAPTGGYTFTGSATTTHNFTLASAASFAVQSGVTLRVEGVFTNSVGGSNTNWNASTLVLDGQSAYTINTKTTAVERYATLVIGDNSDIRMWNSSATTTTVDATGSLYSQDHASVNGNLYVYGDFHVGTTTEYWNYTTDFDGAALGGSPRAVTVAVAQNSTVTVDGGTLNIVGVSGNETTVTNQGSGTYAFNVSAGTFNAQYYEMRNLDANGLNFTGTPTITSLSYGDYELAVNTGTLITVSSTTLNANASLVITGNRFATTTAITGKNVTLTGVTANAWTFVSHTGNLDGEAYDVDGVTACGSVRWADSSCLITQQTHYRWRNDDGGTDVPNSEWFHSSWDARKSVRIDNVDATTYSDAVVQILVDYDSDMQADFDDLRFTEDDGITPIPYWIGSTTVSETAEVWLKVPSLPSEDTATVYMYYNSPGVTSSSSMEDTFIAADDFEDNDITEYSGQTTLFSTGGSFAFDGSYGLDNAGDESSRANTGGIYRLDQTVSQGQTFRFMQYVDIVDGSGDETCVKFGVQSPGSANDNYAICLEQFGTDRITLAKDVVENDSAGGATILASSTVTYATGWYEVEVDWEADDDITVFLYDESGTLVTSFSDNDPSYTSGGIGFTYWFNYGGWDSVGSRPLLTTEPTIRFGAEQADGGASWKAAQDTPASFDINDIARLRVAIENSGLTINNQQFLLEYAAQGAAPSCEAVDPDDFAAVPVQASCGTSPVCMQSSALVTNGAATGDLLTGTAGEYTLGQLREDPSNITTAVTLTQDHFTELEYVITPTVNTVDQNLCFRITNNGTEYDTYLRVAKLQLRFDPAFDTPFLNGGYDISLLPGTTTRVYASTTVTDLNGYTDIQSATTTFYRGGVGAACSVDNNNCYIATTDNTCSLTDCSGNSCTLECYADIYFHADATASSSDYEGEEWFAFMEVEDANNGYDFSTTPGVEMNILRAIDVAGAINYGALAPTFDTESFNASTTIDNEGNIALNVEILGTDMTDGVSSSIPADMQKFATTSFTYNTCLITICNTLSSTTLFELDLDLSKPMTHVIPVEDSIYWGIKVPSGVASNPHTGYNIFYATDE